MVRLRLAVVTAMLAATAAQAEEPLAPQSFSWKRGDKPLSLVPVASHICMLTRVTGKFAGGGERIALYQINGTWQLNGTSQQKELAAGVTCAAKTKFTRYAKAPWRLRSTIYGNHMTGSCAAHVVPLGGNVQSHAFFITGIAGKFQGDGEVVAAVSRPQSGKLGKFGAILVKGCSGFADGTLSSFQDADGFPAFYYDLQGNNRTLTGGNVSYHATDAGPASVSAWEKFWAALPPSGLETKGTMEPEGERRWLAPVDKALCGLTMISGKLQGYGEVIEIDQQPRNGQMWWSLRAKTQAANNWVWAQARCLSRAQ